MSEWLINELTSMRQIEVLVAPSFVVFVVFRVEFVAGFLDGRMEVTSVLWVIIIIIIKSNQKKKQQWVIICGFFIKEQTTVELLRTESWASDRIRRRTTRSSIRPVWSLPDSESWNAKWAPLDCAVIGQRDKQTDRKEWVIADESFCCLSNVNNTWLMIDR